MVIDIHPHIISEDTQRYPICPLGGRRSEWSKKGGSLTAEQLISAMDQAGISQAVVVHSSTTYGHDNSYVADSAQMYGSRLAAVGSIDLMKDDVLDTLQYWIGERGLIGIRLFTRGSTMAQTNWLDDPKTYPAWEWLQQRDIPVCVQISPAGLYMLENIMDRYPGIRFILDHATVPNLEDGYPYGELQSILALARYPKLYIKVTTVNMLAAEKGKSTPQDFMRALVDAYGAERIAWGSNFPASEGKLKDHVEMIRRAISGLTQAEQEAILSGTARAFYGLEQEEWL